MKSAPGPLHPPGVARAGLRIAFLLAVIGTLWGIPAARAERCDGCQTWIQSFERLCPRCLRATNWPTRPPRVRQATIVVRRGRDAFIRSPNDQLSGHRAHHNGGADPTGPLGSFYTLNGLRYLIWFDLPQAFADAGIPLAGFRPERALLLIRTTDQGDARADIPLVVHPLNQIFAEGKGRWGKHRAQEGGCTWFRATDSLPWITEGGDFHPGIHGSGWLPRTGAHTAVIDVTQIYQRIFQVLAETGTWYDPGLILMRDADEPAQCRFRNIHTFESPPSNNQVRSPELYLE